MSLLSTLFNNFGNNLGEELVNPANSQLGSKILTAASGTQAPLSPTNKSNGKSTNPITSWLSSEAGNILTGITGFILIIFGFVFLTQQSKTIQNITKTAAKIAA